MDFSELFEGLEDFALNGKGYSLELNFVSSRDGAEFLETIYIRSEDLNSFAVEQINPKRKEWFRRT